MKKERNDDFKIRVRKAMDLIVYNSVNIHMAVAVFSINSLDALSMFNYIKQNL